MMYKKITSKLYDKKHCVAFKENLEDSLEACYDIVQRVHRVISSHSRIVVT